MTCTLCDACKSSPVVNIEGAGDTPNDVMIITDYPSFFEVTELKIGYSTRWLAEELASVGINLAEVYFTYALKCFVDSPTKAQLKACRQLLYNEIEQVQPKYILLLGGSALYSMFSKTAITKFRGEVLDYSGIKVLPTYHPNSVMRKPEELTVFRADLYYFKRMIDNSWDDLSKFKWRIVRGNKDIDTFVSAVKSSKLTSYDLETTGLKDTDTGKLLLLGVATKPEVFVFPWERPESTLTKRTLVELSNWYFEQSDKKVAQNGKFDNRWLRTRGVTPRTDFDTFLAAYTLNNTLPHGLKYLAKVEFGANNYDEGVEFTEDFPLEKQAEYCALDCYYTRKLAPILWRRLKNNV